MSLHRTLAHSAALQIAGKALSTLLGFVAIAFMTRSLGTEQFGWYITASGFLQFIGIMSDFGFTVTTSNMLSEPEYDKQKLLNTAFTWRLITALFFQGLAPLVFLLFPYPSEIKMAVAVVSLSFFALTLQQVFVGYYRQKLEMLIPTIADIVARVLLVAGVAFAWYTKAGFITMMGAISFASLVGTIYLWSRMPSIKLSIDRAISKILFIKMWPTALSIIFNAIYLQGDRVILPLYVSQSEVGLYGAAYRVVDIIIQTSAIIMGIVMPLITYSWSRGDKTEFTKRAQLGLNMLALVIIPMLAGIFVLAEQIMLFTAGPSFAEAGIMLRWLSICIFGICFGMAFGHIILAIDRQREALWIYLTNAILSVVGYLVFIPRYGWMGAVGVTIFSEIYAGLGHTILTLYYSKTKFSFSIFFRICLASTVMGTVVYTLQPLPLWSSMILGALSYTVLIIVLRVTTLDQIKSLLSRTKVVDAV